MTHDELRDRLLDLACGELTPREAREVEDHAAACAACGAELAAMRGTRRIMAALPVEPAPEDGARVLVAAAREAVRARSPGRAWRRWLWAAPLAASLAVVVAVSVRIGAPPPPSAAREDVHALRGGPAEAPRAAAPAAPSAAASGPGEAAAGAAPRATPSQRASAPGRGGEAEEEARAGVRAAPAAEPSAAAVARIRVEERAPPGSADRVEPSAAAPPAGAAAAEAAPPAAVAAGSAPPAAMAAAAPPPAARRAKAFAAPGADAGAAAGPASSRDRAVAAAEARAHRVGVDLAGTTAAVEGPTTLEAWRAGATVAAPAALAGHRFWAVAFTPVAPGARPALTVFVEDGSFRPLGEVRAR